MVGLHLAKCFLRVNAVPIVPGHASWVMLFDINAETFKDMIEGLDPFNMGAVPASSISISISQGRLYRNMRTFLYIR